jgi:hypothetical protein
MTTTDTIENPRVTVQAVLDNHPEIFQAFFASNARPETSKMYWGLEVPEEDFPEIINEVCTVWTKLPWPREQVKPQLRADQVDEHNGRLRFLYHFEDASSGDILRATQLFDALLFYAETRLTNIKREALLWELEIDKSIDEAYKELKTEDWEGSDDPRNT